MQTRYVELGGTVHDLAPLPTVPEPPKFSNADYPTCKDAWKSEPDNIKKPDVVYSCMTAYSKFNNYFISYRTAMNVFLDNIKQIIINVQNSSNYTEATRLSFVNQLQMMHKGGQDDGYLMQDYRTSMTNWQKDYTELKDSHNRATGCGGYPTPKGFGPCLAQ